MSIWDTVIDTAGDVTEFVGGGGRELGRWVAGGAAPEPGVSEVVHGIRTVGHLAGAGYDAVTGDRHGAIEHGSEAMVDSLGVIPGISEGLEGINAAIGASALVQDQVTPGSHAPTTLGGMIGRGINGAVDMVAGAPDEHQQTSTAEAVCGTIGALAGGLGGGMLSAGIGAPAGVVGGGMVGRSVGGWMDRHLFGHYAE